MVCVAKYAKGGNLSILAQIYVGTEKRSVHFEEAMYTERNVAMYSDSKQERKKQNTVKSLCEKA